MLNVNLFAVNSKLVFVVYAFKLVDMKVVSLQELDTRVQTLRECFFSGCETSDFISDIPDGI